MKKSIGVLILLLLSGMILEAIQPAMLFAGSTSGGNIWDQFVYTQPFHGTKLQGTLSIYYEYNFVAGDFVYCADESSIMVTMYYTARLKKQKDPTLWVFNGSSQRSRSSCGICLTDVIGQAEEVTNFLNGIVTGTLPATPTLFPSGVKEWHLTAINNGQFYDGGLLPSRGFVADIVITVKPN